MFTTSESCTEAQNDAAAYMELAYGFKKSFMDASRMADSSTYKKKNSSFNELRKAMMQNALNTRKRPQRIASETCLAALRCR